MEEQVDSRPNEISEVVADDRSDEEDIVPINSKKIKKIAVLSDTDSDEDKLNIDEPVESVQEQSDSESNQDVVVAKKRILKIADSDSDSNFGDTLPQKSCRIHNKQTELANKFKNMSRKSANTVESNEPIVNFRESKVSDLYDSESSDDNVPDDHDIAKEYPQHNVDEGLQKKTKIKPAKNTPQRMSAKQAMEQMHKIKSESCRMLREKQLYLPYHRPKQVTLKDIIDRKKINFLPGAKKLTLRMSEEQLKEYAKQLEEKEKEMLELCKSESEEEDEEDCKNDDNVEIETSNSNLKENSVNLECSASIPDDLKINNSEETDHINLIINNKNTENELLSDSEIEKTQDDTINKIIDSLSTSVHQGEDSVCHSESQPLDSKSLPLVSERISCSLPAKPKISGTPGTFINFNSDVNELSIVDVFKQNFIYQTSLKSAEDIEREQEKKLPPGTALMNFKRELENKISRQRFEEWTKRMKDEVVKNKENHEIDDELSECEELLKKETYSEDKVSNLDENEVEEIDDEEEEEIEIKYPKRKPKNSYIEDEAESEDDCSNIEEEDSEEDTDNDELVKFDESGKRTLTRITKPFRESDSSDDDDGKNIVQLKNDLNSSNTVERMEEDIPTESPDDKNNLNDSKTLNRLEKTEVSDIFDSQNDKNNDESVIEESDDHLTLGQNCASGTNLSLDNKSFELINNTPVRSGGRPDLGNLISPLIKLTGVSPVDNNSELPSSLSFNLSPKKDSSTQKWIHLQENLFMDSETSDLTQGTQDIADLCSGKFPSQLCDNSQMDPQFTTIYQINPIKSAETEMTQNTEKELLELCSGKFPNDNNDEIEKCTPENSILIKEINDINANKTNRIARDVHEKPKVPPKNKTIKSFFTNMAMNVNSSPKTHINNGVVKNIENVINSNETALIADSPKQKFIISSSSSNDELDIEAQEKRTKVLKSKKERNRKRAKPLQISDDESDNEEDEDCTVEYESAPDDVIDDREIEYDSEENEIEIQKETVDKASNVKKSSEFFDHEAELTSEDEWKGSGDEDEKGLDEFEWEEGDADQIDEKKVSKELERIHRHQMLDQDNREIKLLQEILLEDGDLEGGTRERKFRWKNVDNSIESGAVVGDDNPEEAPEEAQTEEEWRKQRHERETFLRQMMEKENITSQESLVETSIKTSIRTSLIRASITSSAIKTAKTSNSSIESNHTNNEIDVPKKPRELPSPVKKPFIMMQNKFKGFLSRGEASLNRLALLAKTGQPAKENESTTNLKPTNHRNFVFTTVSPPCNDVMTEDVKRVKRKIATEVSTPLLIKKIKLNESESSKFKKSLFDHLE